MLIETRIAHTDDAPLIALLGRVTFTETFGHLFRDKQDLLAYYEATFSVAKIASSLAKPNNIFWIAFVNQLPVGYAKLKLNSRAEFVAAEHICQLQKIYVLRDFLSLKVGRILQEKVLEKAQAVGNEKIWLSVLSSNERAIAFYTKSGFEPVGRHDFRIGKEQFDFVAMAKTFHTP